ncbi:MAG TPA: ferric reductase-like transmembrane domain-containing protein [Vicinamibacterales bacterium]
MPTAIDVSSVVGLVAVGMFTAQILLGLLISTGYNPVRQWPGRRMKLFTFHNWIGYTALATAATHPLILLFAPNKEGGRLFRLFDIAVPIWSPIQPLPNTLGAIAFYLVFFVVVTSYFRHLFGHHNWKLLHYTAYAAAGVFYTHGILADPLLQNRPVDWIDAEKVYVEGCAALVLSATVWRMKTGGRRSRARIPPRVARASQV